MTQRVDFASPEDLVSLDGSLRIGLSFIGTIACISAIVVFSLICFIGYRFVTWRRYYREPLQYNQCVVLIFNLLLADSFQALGLLISLHWVTVDSISSGTPACWAQAGFLQFGDVCKRLLCSCHRCAYNISSCLWQASRLLCPTHWHRMRLACVNSFGNCRSGTIWRVVLCESRLLGKWKHFYMSQTNPHAVLDFSDL